MWTFITTYILAKHAEIMYPFLYSILALYCVSVLYLKTIVEKTNRKMIRLVESKILSVSHKKQLIEKEYEKKKIMNGVFYCWNAGLSIFSLMGAMHLFPEIIRKMGENKYRDYWCEPISHYDSLTLEWLSYFHLSKFIEFGDTILLVLRGKQPTFLHIYHHISVAAISWESIVQMPSHILTGAFINYFIHFVMYLYFALQIYGRVPIWFRSYWITYMQIGQMAIGVFGSMETLYYILQENAVENGDTALILDDTRCSASQEFVITGLLLYVSYFWLFLDFYRNKARVQS